VQVLRVQPVDAGTLHVFATVHDSGGRRIDGLGAANFTASIGRGRVAAAAADRVDYGAEPLSAVLLLDTSGSMHSSVAALRDASAAFVDRLGPADSCSVMTFGDGVKTLSGFTSEKQQLLSILRNVQAREAKTFLYQAVDDALNRAAVAPSARTAVVLLTDGHDEGSAVTPDEINKKIDRVRVPVYTVAFGSSADAALLRRLAALSRGAYFQASDDSELKGVYLAILDQLKTVYRVTFTTGALAAGPHTLNFGVTLRGASAQTKHDFTVESSGGGVPPPRHVDRFSWRWLAALALVLLAVGGWLTWRRAAATHAQRAVPDLEKTVVPPKVWLDVIGGVHAGEKLLLFDESNTLGRDSNSCQVCLPRDPLVGRVHARVFGGRDGLYVVEDLGSQNGTRVNDVPIRDAVALQSGDTISVGMSQLRFTDGR